MKKISTLIFLTLFSFIYSCDKEETQNTDLIVGKWEYSTEYENNIQFTQNECKPSTIEFKSNGNKNYLYYSTNTSGNCVIIDNINSTWVKTDSNTYQFSYNGYTHSQTATFENKNKRLILQNYDSDGSGNIVIYKIVYNRLN